MATKRLAARKPADYDSRVHGRRETNIPQDDHTINEGICPVNLLRPRYDDGPMYFIPFKHPSYEDPENMLQPGRTAPEPGAYSHWLIRMEVAAYIGLPDCTKHSFNLRHPADKEAKKGNPYRELYFAAAQAHDNGQFGNGKKWDSSWNKFLKGSKKSGGAALSRPTAKYFVQGAVFCNGDRDYMEGDRELPFGLAQGDDLTVIQIPVSAGQGIIKLLDIEKDQYEGNGEDDPSAPFKWGDPTGRFKKKARTISGCKVFCIYNPKKTKIKQDTSFSGEFKEIQGYEAAIKEAYKAGGQVLFDGNLETKQVDFIFEHAQFWFDDEDSGTKGLLRIAPVEQQALWVAQAFKSAPKLIAFAWSEQEGLMTDEVKAVLAARVSAVVPGEDDDDDDDEDDETPKRKVKKDPSAKAGKKAKPEADDEDDDEDDEEETSKKGKKPAKGKKAKDEEDEEDEFEDDEDSDDDSDDDEEEDEKPAKKGKSKKAKDDDEDDDSDDEEEDDDSDDEDDSDEDDDSDDEEEDDDSDDEEEDDDSDDEDDSDEEEDEKPAKKGKSKKPAAEDDEEEEDDDSDDEDDEEEEDDDSEDDDSDDEDDEEEEDDDEDDEKPAKKGKKPAAKDDDEEEDDEDDEEEDEDDDKPTKKGSKDKKPAAKVGKKPEAKAEKPAAKKGKGKKGDEEDYFGDSDAGKAASKSAKAAKAAKDNSAKRGSAPKKEAPKPPASKGGSAKRKQK